MLTIEIHNSFSRISGLTAQQEKALKEELSYTVGGSSSYFSGFRPKRRTLLGKKGEFPTGLLNAVRAFLPSPYSLIDRRVRPKPANVTITDYPLTPHKAQLEALNKALNYGRGIIAMPTGTGKSFVIYLIARTLGLKTLVVVPSVEIKQQLAATLSALKNVTVLNIDNPKLKTLTEFDVLIIDEAHHVAAKTYQRLNKIAWTGIYHRFFMTATPFRNDAEEMLLFESIAGNCIYKLTYAEAIRESYIVPVEGFYIEPPKQKTDAYTYREVYNKLVINNHIRNEMIAVLLLRLHAESKRTICLVKEIAHGKILSDITGLPFVSGEDEESRDYIRQFNNGGIMAVIGTTGVLGEGVDTKPAEYIIIAGLGKAKSNIMQSIGRGVRKYPGKESAKIILIRDNSHKFTLRHFNEQKKILMDEYGAVVLQLKL